MTTSFIDIKFYMVHCLFITLWLSWLKQKLIRARGVCNIERAFHYYTITIETN